MSLESMTENKPWWNRPLIGDISLIERIIGYINRKEVPELALSLHNAELQELEKLTPIIQMQDNNEFGEQFLLYLSLKEKIENNQDEYKGINTFVRILRFAIHRNKHFQNLRRIELDYQGKTQRELYDFVYEQLNNNLDASVFRKTIHQKIDYLLAILKNELIKEALISYRDSLEVISEESIGLNLLFLFKKYKITDYTVFKIISDIIKQIKKQDLTNLKALVLVAKINYEELEKLGHLIGISQKNNEPIVYAQILQYIALSQKYERLNYRFEQLQANLIQWQKNYKTLHTVREEYPSHKYKLPKEFLQIIPGENIYIKYKDFLSIS